MLNNRRVLAIVPARGGSKGIPGKNLMSVAGKPLFQWLAETLEEIDEIDRAVVSTDSEEIALLARKFGLDCPFYRPDYLSGDRVGDIPVLTHALEETERILGEVFDLVLMLQVTSPLRTPRDIRESLKLLEEKNADSVWTVSPVDLSFHPLKQISLRPDGRAEYFDGEGAQIIARQQLSQTYFRNGSCYVLTRDQLLVAKSLMGERTFGLVSEGPRVSIDSIDDVNEIERVFNASK